MVCWPKVELETIQKMENGVRGLLCTPGYVPVVIQRGEVGTFNMQTRDFKGMINSEKYLMENEIN